MTVMPGTVWVGEQSPRSRMISYDVFCIHTIVGHAPAHAAHFSPRADGIIFQSRSIDYQSAANLYGNPYVIASENEDHGPEFGGTPQLPQWVPMTREQVVANGRILAWLHEKKGIPLQLCPNSRPGSRGLAHHRQGIDGNFGGYRFGGRVSGGRLWSSSFGKVCPTDIRILQLADILSVAKNGGRDDEVVTNKEMNEIASRAAEKAADLLKPVMRDAVKSNRLDMGGEHTRSDDAVARNMMELLRSIRDSTDALVQHFEVQIAESVKSKPKTTPKPGPQPRS